MYCKVRTLVAAQFVAFLFTFALNSISYAQSLSSSVFETQMYNPSEAAFDSVNGIPYNYIGTPTVSDGSSPIYSEGASQPASTTNPGALISVVSSAGSYGEDFFLPNGPAPYTFSDLDVSAQTNYGANHVSATIDNFDDGYLTAKSLSTWSDTFTLSASPGVIGTTTANFTGDTVQFVFDVDGSVSGEGAASLDISANVAPDTSGSTGSYGASGLGVQYSTYDALSQGYFDPTPITSDDYSFSGSGNAVLTTQSYLLSSNSITPTVTMTAQVNPGLYVPNNGNPPVSGSADFGDTGSLVGFDLYNAAGQLINPDDYVVTPMSGGSYSFQPAPEAQTYVSFAAALVVLFGLTLRFRKRTKAKG